MSSNSSTLWPWYSCTYPADWGNEGGKACNHRCVTTDTHFHCRQHSPAHVNNNTSTYHHQRHRKGVRRLPMGHIADVSQNALHHFKSIGLEVVTQQTTSRHHQNSLKPNTQQQITTKKKANLVRHHQEINKRLQVADGRRIVLGHRLDPKQQPPLLAVVQSAV